MTTHTGERALNVFVSLNPVRIQVNRFGQIIHEGERRFDYAMPESGEPEALIDGQPYVFGVVFFDAVIDTAALRVLGFHGFRLRKLGSVSDLPMGLRIELDDRPDHVDNRVRCFETWWPMTLDFDRLPDTVVNLFSERVGHPVLLYHEYYGL